MNKTPPPISSQLSALNRAASCNDAKKTSSLLDGLDKTIITKSKIPDISRDNVHKALASVEQSLGTNPEILGQIHKVRDQLKTVGNEQGHIQEFKDVLKGNSKANIFIEVMTGNVNALRKRGYSITKFQLLKICIQVFNTQYGEFVKFSKDKESAIKLLIALNFFPEEISTESVIYDALVKELAWFKKPDKSKSRSKKTKKKTSRTSKKSTTKKTSTGKTPARRRCK